MEGSVGTTGAVGANHSGVSSGGLLLQHFRQRDFVAAAGVVVQWHDRTDYFLGPAGRENVSGRIKLRAADPTAPLVGRTGGAASGYWTGTDLDRFISRKQNCVEGGTLPCT